MTIWKAGMLAVCVKRGAWRQAIPGRGPTGKRPAFREVLRVSKAGAHPVTGAPCLWFDGFDSAGFYQRRFRPLIDQQDDLDLIAKIKACKPKRAPVIPDRRHVISGFPTATASDCPTSPDSRVSDGGRVISHDAPAITLAQSHENSIRQHIKSDSFVAHRRGITSHAQQD